MDLKPGDWVAWKWAAGIAEGRVVEIRAERTTIETKGKTIVRNGSPEKPAVIIVQENGTKVLKLASELQKTS